MSRRHTLLALLVALLLGMPAQASAQGKPRPTIQHRFATKKHKLYGHLTGTTILRNDFYHTVGTGVDLGYYFTESFGAELRWLLMANWEVDSAAQIRKQTGLVPDARPQNMLLAADARYSMGYGKVFVFDSFLVHFDPQLIGGAGITLAEGRVLPTATIGVSLLTHYRYGVQAKLDMQVVVQAEHRTRGWVGSVGFMPTLGIGWSFDPFVTGRAGGGHD